MILLELMCRKHYQSDLMNLVTITHTIQSVKCIYIYACIYVRVCLYAHIYTYIFSWFSLINQLHLSVYVFVRLCGILGRSILYACMRDCIWHMVVWRIVIGHSVFSCHLIHTHTHAYTHIHTFLLKICCFNKLS